MLQTEVSELKRRLHKAEKDVLNSKEECLHLTNNTSALEREVILSNVFILSILKIQCVSFLYLHNFLKCKFYVIV